MKYNLRNINIPPVYRDALTVSVVVFIGIYFLVANVFLDYVFVVKFREKLDISASLFAYLIVINLTTILMYGYDKFKAVYRKGMRVPENILHLLEALGGSIGALIARKLFMHKTKKVSFYKITWIILVLQIAFLTMPWILQLSFEQQMIVWIVLPIILVGLYFMDTLK